MEHSIERSKKNNHTVVEKYNFPRHLAKSHSFVFPHKEQRKKTAFKDSAY